MAKPLSYPSLKCVFEYFEANKRIHITSRCPALRKIDLKVPLRLDSLTFRYSSITLNDITFQLYTRINGADGDHENVPYATNQLGIRDNSADRILFPGDIPMRSDVDYRRTELTTDNRQTQRIYLHLKKGFNYRSVEVIAEAEGVPKHRVPEHLEFHVAMKRLSSFLLGTRSNIIVKRLEVVDTNDWRISIIRVPIGLQLSVKELDINPDHIKFLIPIITNNSLRKLKIQKCYWNDPCFGLPIVHSVQKLSIQGWSGRAAPSWNKTLLKLPNRNITLNFLWISNIEMKNFIQELLAEGRDIGTCYVISYSFSITFTVLKEFEKRFGRKMYKKSTKKINKPYISYYSIRLPMTPTSELSIRSNRCWSNNHVRLEVVPITSVK